ncbi:MAG: cytochrome D ubiquinol oxidase subunit II [Limimaricola sp.]|uniref:LOG family protein n=1 Tax=Limimaricola sp. TaxID=2211665 RepID=UPI001D932ED7|nr:LOG family protein [Limimaricola sp.]MBI1416014.1 cytochrome D ubiquinol oxidase subunit II [Limimaricola sp.]
MSRKADPATPPPNDGTLPWQVPKEPRDDPDAPARIRSTMENPSYRMAEDDPDFLGSDAVRGPRLELDYLKTELGLAAHGIGHTVVVFGSTRICEPQAAARLVAEAEARLAEAPDDPDRQRDRAIAGRLAAKAHYYDIAREFAALIAARGDRPHGERIAVMTGGGPGIMEAANRGAWAEGAPSVGLNIALPHEQFPNPYLTPGLCFQFHYFALRKLHFLQRARALVAFPGGYGTFDELFETLVLIQTRKMPPLPVVLIGPEFWSQAVNFDFLVAEGVIAPADRALFHFATTAGEAFAHIAGWYRARGQPLFD